MKRAISVFLLGLLLAVTCLPAYAQTPTPTSTSPGLCDKWARVMYANWNFAIPYCGSGHLSGGNRTATTAVFVIQSSSLNASDVYASMSRAANTAGKASTTVILAPQFPLEGDIVAHNLPSTVPVWSEDGWKFGEDSLKLSGDRQHQIGSYAVLDLMIQVLLDRDRYPRLNRIVIAGQSAGGMFTQRYAAINKVHAAAETRNIHMRYVIMNPSSYLYLDNKRSSPIALPNRGLNLDAENFRVVDAAFIEDLNDLLPASEQHDYDDGGCRAYNRYPWGLERLGEYPYAAGLSAATIKAEYLKRDIRYLMGKLDTGRASAGLSKSCASDVQGLDRNQRADMFWSHLLRLSPPRPGIRAPVAVVQWLVSVPGVGHSSNQMINSSQGLQHIFDYPGPAVRTGGR